MDEKIKGKSAAQIEDNMLCFGSVMMKIESLLNGIALWKTM